MSLKILVLADHLMKRFPTRTGHRRELRRVNSLWKGKPHRVTLRTLPTHLLPEGIPGIQYESAGFALVLVHKTTGTLKIKEVAKKPYTKSLGFNSKSRLHAFEALV